MRDTPPLGLQGPPVRPDGSPRRPKAELLRSTLQVARPAQTPRVRVFVAAALGKRDDVIYLSSFTNASLLHAVATQRLIGQPALALLDTSPASLAFGHGASHAIQDR